MGYLTKYFVSSMFHVFNIVPKIMDLTSNTNIYFFNKWRCYVVFKKGINISSFITNITDYCRFHCRAAGHIPLATLGSRI
jgi:hypothetical protein